MIETETLQTKVIDFGAATNMAVVPQTIYRGTWAFAPPESLWGSFLLHRAEAWAVGMVLYKMLYIDELNMQDPNILGKFNINQRIVTQNSYFPVSKHGNGLLRALLDRDPAKRCTLDQVAEQRVSVESRCVGRMCVIS
jgi:serine/threonine protein kinase